MNPISLKPIFLLAIILLAMTALVGCGLLPAPFGQAAPTRTSVVFPPTTVPTDVPPSPTIPPPATPTPMPAATNATGAATLRVTLERLLSEHTVLLAQLSAASFDGRTDEFRAINAALDANSVDLSKTFGQIYGPDVEKQFLVSWRTHIGLFVDYLGGTIAKNKAKQDKAISDLNAWSDSLGDMLNKANPKLDKGTIAGLFKTNIQNTKDVLDAHAAKDYPKSYTATRKAFAQMDAIAVVLATGIAAQAPDKFDGKADASGANLRASFTGLLTEHVFLVSAASRAALNNQATEFKAANDALTANSVDLSKAISGVYGADAEKNFLALWNKHNGLYVDYMTGLVKKDKAAQDKAMSDLQTFAGDFGKFIETLTSKNLAADAATGFAKANVQSVKDLVDAQAAKDYAKTANVFRTAFAQMPMLADPLADAAVKQFPDKFK